MSEFVGASESATMTSQGEGLGNQASVLTHDPKTGQKLAVNKNSVSQKLAKVMPSRTPLDSMLRNIGTGSCKSDKYEFFSLFSRGVKAVVESVTIPTPYDYQQNTPVDITLSSGIHSLSKDGNLIVPTLNVKKNGTTATVEAATAAMHPLVLNISSINYTQKKITVVGVNGPVTSALKQNAVLYRLAAAKDQDAAISDDPQSTPTKDFNFCQRNLCTVSENAFQALQEKEVEFSMAELKEQALADFRWQTEMQTIFGAGAHNAEAFMDPETMKRKLHMRGLLDFNIQEIDLSGSDKDIAEKLNEACEDIFAGNNGSEERLFIYGPEVATLMANSSVWQKRMDAAKTEVKWGVKWKLIETNFGTLRGVMQPGFGLLGDYSKCAVVVDPANIRRVEQVALRSRNLDLQGAGIRNSKDVLLEEAWTLEVTNPQTHAFIRF